MLLCISSFLLLTQSETVYIFLYIIHQGDEKQQSSGWVCACCTGNQKLTPTSNFNNVEHFFSYKKKRSSSYKQHLLLSSFFFYPFFFYSFSVLSTFYFLSFFLCLFVCLCRVESRGQCQLQCLHGASSRHQIGQQRRMDMPMLQHGTTTTFFYIKKTF